MTSLKSIFETCRPGADAEAGPTRDEKFAPDLAQIVNGAATKEYLSHPADTWYGSGIGQEWLCIASGPAGLWPLSGCF